MIHKNEGNKINHINCSGYILSVGQVLTKPSVYVDNEVIGTITGLYLLNNELVIEMNNKHYALTTTDNKDIVETVALALLDHIDAETNLTYNQRLLTYFTPGFRFKCYKTFKLPDANGWNIKYWKCYEYAEIKKVEYLEDVMEITLKGVHCGKETFTVQFKNDASDVDEVLQYLHLRPLI